MSDRQFFTKQEVQDMLEKAILEAYNEEYKRVMNSVADSMEKIAVQVIPANVKSLFWQLSSEYRKAAND